jgi:serine protease Do
MDRPRAARAAILSLLALLAAAATHAQSAFDNETAASGVPAKVTFAFARVRSKVQPGDDLGHLHTGMFCGSDSTTRAVANIEQVTNNNVKAAFKVVSREADLPLFEPELSPFESAAPRSADYLLGGVLQRMTYDACVDGLKRKGSVEVEMRWELFSTKLQRVVLAKTTIGSFKTDDYVAGGLDGKAYQQSLQALFQSPEFKALEAGRLPDGVATPTWQPLHLRAGATIDGDPQGRADALTKAVVTIISDLGSGTGFYIADGYLLTDRHVVGSSKYVKVKLSSGKQLVGEVIRQDASRDVALLQTESAGVPSLRVSLADPPVGTIQQRHRRRRQDQARDDRVALRLDRHPRALARQQRAHQAEAGYASRYARQREARRQPPWLAMAMADRAVGAVDAAADVRRRLARRGRAVLDRVGEQLVDGQRDRDRIGLGQREAVRRRAVTSTWIVRPNMRCTDAAIASTTPRTRIGPVTPTCSPCTCAIACTWLTASAIAPAASGWRDALCCSRPATPCRLFLMRWCTSLISISRCAIAAARRASSAARCAVTSEATISSWSGASAAERSETMRMSHTRCAPSRFRRRHADVRCTSKFALHAARRGERAVQVGRQLRALRAGQPLRRHAAEDLLHRPARERRGHLVQLHHLLARGVEQRDGQRRGLDDALQAGARLHDAHLGLAAALDVQQRVGELAVRRVLAGDDDVADDPEVAPVARAQPAFEGLGLAFLQRLAVVGAAQRVVELVAGDDRDRRADEVGQLAAEHAARRAVHPLDAGVADGDDAHQHRVEDGARAVGLQHQRLARALAVVDVDEGHDGARRRLVDGHRPRAHLRPEQRAVAPRTWRSPCERPSVAMSRVSRCT